MAPILMKLGFSASGVVPPPVTREKYKGYIANVGRLKRN